MLCYSLQERTEPCPHLQFSLVRHVRHLISNTGGEYMCVVSSHYVCGILLRKQ